MPLPNQAESSLAPPSFAGLLATLAAPAQQPPPDWDDTALADDVTTLSYERALRAHARYRASAPAQQPAPSLAMDAAAEPSAPAARSRKSASITLRLSNEECAQLHQRAAEAGLTVSAYLRFCTLEVESLRAQVKEALAELRSTSQKEQAPPAATRPSRLRKLFRFRA